MLRIALFTLIGVCYVATATMLVQWQGHRFREAHAVDRPGGLIVEGVPAGSGMESVQRAPAPLVPPPAPGATLPAPSTKVVQLPISPVLPLPMPGPAPAPVVVAAVEPPLMPPPALIKADPPKRPPLPPGRPASDIETLTDEDERESGVAIHELIMRSARKAPDGLQARRARELLGPLLKTRKRKEISYAITVLDSDSINAFSHLGGYIYLSRGLFDMIGEDVELEFTLARELAHVDRRDSATGIARLAKEHPGLDLTRAAYRQIAAGYSAEQELQADEAAFRQLLKLERSPFRARSFLRKLSDFADRHEEVSGRRRPGGAPEDEVQDIENHWRSAPAAFERLDRLESLTD
jgi:hypothetical protein